MNWRDFFYFSNGERKVFLFLLCLTAISAILLIIHSTNDIPEKVSETQYIVNPENAPRAIVIDTTNYIPAPSQKKQSTVKNKKINSPNHNPTTYTKATKYPAGTIVELNTADTTILKMVPGIGSTFARRIVRFRDLLGGFYSVEQLREVYGIDEERYQLLRKWFHVDPTFIAQLPINYLPTDSLARHPYLNYKQARSIYLLRKQKGKLSGWENLHLLDEFSTADVQRLNAYLSFK